MNKFKALILKFSGTNCEIETKNIMEKIGFKSSIKHINEIRLNPSIIHNYSFIVLPGGFSYGDYTGSGRIASSIIKHNIFNDIKKFINDGKLILGICNGFQILVKSGLLPNSSFDYTQESSLIFNDVHHYVDIWINLKIENNSVFTKECPGIISLPIAHAEGKFIYEKKKFKIDDYIVMKYCDENGKTTDKYPVNPNGSMENIAAIKDKTGRIMGMMPHPERFYIKQNHFLGDAQRIDGVFVFKNAYNFIKEEL